MKYLAIALLFLGIGFFQPVFASAYPTTVVIDDFSYTPCAEGCQITPYIEDFESGIIIRNVSLTITSSPFEDNLIFPIRLVCDGDRDLIIADGYLSYSFQLNDLSYACLNSMEIFGDFGDWNSNVSIVVTYQSGLSVFIPATVVSSVDSGNISIGLAILTVLAFLMFTGYIFNRLPGKKKLWA